jgi:hypothetical protein
MDSWYTTIDLFEYAIKEQKIFYCPIKSNRKIDNSGDKEPHKQVFNTSFSNNEVKHGKLVKIFKMPMDTLFKLFLVLRGHPWVVSDAMLSSCIVKKIAAANRQLIGIQNSQCRLQRSQSNHIAIAAIV